MDLVLWTLGGMVGGWVARWLLGNDDDDGGAPAIDKPQLALH